MPVDKTQKDIEHFNDWSRTYDESWVQRFAAPAHQDMLDVAVNVVSAPRSILDVGCGTGQLLIKAAARWPSAQLAGVDPAEGMVEIARRQIRGATVYLGSAESLPISDASVDMVFSSISFHHWTDQARGLREIARVLRPAGCLCITDMTMPNWLSKILRRVKVKGSTEMTRLFTEAGLIVKLQRRSTSRFVLLTLGIKKSDKV
jgi:ubiquinone/menaquinone biosynthesis C-methylase UbiE